MIRSKCFFNFRSIIFDIVYTPKGKGVARWDPPHVIRSQVLSACQVFRSVAFFFLLAKEPFLAFFKYKRGVAI